MGMASEHSQEWFEKETKNMSRRQIAQELECNFNMSGETVFHPDKMKMLSEFVTDPKYRTGFDRNYWIWKEAESGVPYLLSADVARGDGKDFSVFHIFDTLTMEIVAEYQGRVTPDLFSKILTKIFGLLQSQMVFIKLNKVRHVQYLIIRKSDLNTTNLIKKKKMVYPHQK